MLSALRFDARHSPLRIGIAALLLVTGGLKCMALLQGKADSSWTSSPAFQTFTVELEILLALWLIWGTQIAGAWLASSAFFTVGAVVNSIMLSQRVASCGCFGTYATSPATPLIADLTLLAVLVFFRPTERFLRQKVALWKIASVTCIGGIFFVALFLFSTDNKTLGGMSLLRGMTIAASPQSVFLGEGSGGMSRTIETAFTNSSSHRIRLTGMWSCACLPAQPFPILLEPGESRVVAFHTHLPQTPGPFSSQFPVYTDDSETPVIVISFSGVSLCTSSVEP